MKFKDYYDGLTNLQRRDFFARAGTSRQMMWKWRRGQRTPRIETIETLAAATEGHCSFFEVQQFFRDLADAMYIAGQHTGTPDVSVEDVDVNSYGAVKMAPVGEIALEIIDQIHDKQAAES